VVAFNQPAEDETQADLSLTEEEQDALAEAEADAEELAADAGDPLGETEPTQDPLYEYLTREKVAELEELIRRVGISWNRVHEVTGVPLGSMQAVRSRRRPFPWRVWFPYFQAVAEAIESIPVPPMPEPWMAPARPQSGFDPATRGIEPPVEPSVPVDKIVETLATLYVEAESFGIGERESAQDAYGRIASRLGIETTVATVIRTMLQVAREAPMLPNARGVAGVLRDRAA
jgi:hypothetical protein